MKQLSQYLLIATAGLILAGCTGGPPGGLTVVENFDITRYEGRWYEIARLDHRFERGLTDVTADYTLQDDNTVRVVNRGYSATEQDWDEAVGRARFVGEQTVGALKVSFFGPFYGAYNIVALDQQSYEWALITGPNHNYLWILAREPVLDEATRQRLITMAAQAGFETDNLMTVSHTRQPE